MSLTRPMLKGMNLTEEQVGAIIEAHTETVDALKRQRDQYKEDAEKLPKVQKQLDEYKNGKDWQAELDKKQSEYDKLKQSFDDYKTDVANKEALATKKTQYRKMLDDLKINKDDADLIMAGTDFNVLKLDSDGKLSDVDGLTNTAKERYKRYIPTVDTKGADVETPPGDKGNSGANPRAAERAKLFHERRYGAAPANNGADNKTD